MSTKFTVTTLATELEFYECEHCGKTVPTIFCAPGQASYSDDFVLFNDKQRQAGIKEAEKNASRKARKRLRYFVKHADGRKHRCIKCGKFSSEYLNDLKSQYEKYYAKTLSQIQCYYLFAWPVLALALIALTFVVIYVVRWSEASTWNHHFITLGYSLYSLALWIIVTIFLYATRVEYRRPLTKKERDELLDRRNNDLNVSRWLDNLEKNDEALYEILKGVASREPSLFTHEGHSAYARWMNFEDVLTYEPEEPRRWFSA